MQTEQQTEFSNFNFFQDQARLNKAPLDTQESVKKLLPENLKCLVKIRNLKLLKKAKFLMWILNK